MAQMRLFWPYVTYIGFFRQYKQHKSDFFSKIWNRPLSYVVLNQIQIHCFSKWLQSECHIQHLLGGGRDKVTCKNRHFLLTSSSLYLLIIILLPHSAQWLKTDAHMLACVAACCLWHHILYLWCHILCACVYGSRLFTLESDSNYNINSCAITSELSVLYHRSYTSCFNQLLI